MIVTLIIACEVGFWVLLALGLAVRYLLKWRRTSTVLLLCEPLLELVLFVVTAIDLKNGAEPSWQHGVAAIYIGFTVAYGHYTIRWLDGHAAHRWAGAPRPPKPPKYGMKRAAHEIRFWLRTVVAAAVAWVLLEAAARYIGQDGNIESLRNFQTMALRAAAIHGLVALAYVVFPKKDPAIAAGKGRASSSKEKARR
ncbi:hypothetical protein [Streptomyces capitiformicae]|uniref:Uncharacterized protein n=1 Tax=Streptomyces capitiformicae TaxID=2014920 RepID=A0A918ZNI0_9ACTN|nr:hypothetical protein [Streptomyces capitiformicae]GHE61601.1 hypothetical protein GCM10017771_84930 [Streptomyces capitiformicae]